LVADRALVLTDFDYELPAELIAQEPVGVRGESRLLVVDRAGKAGRAGRAGRAGGTEAGGRVGGWAGGGVWGGGGGGVGGGRVGGLWAG